MEQLVEWLSSYGAEYDANKKVLYIRKSMQVGDFVELKKILKEMGKLEDIIVESEGKVWKMK